MDPDKQQSKNALRSFAYWFSTICIALAINYSFAADQQPARAPVKAPVQAKVQPASQPTLKPTLKPPTVQPAPQTQSQQLRKPEPKTEINPNYQHQVQVIESKRCAAGGCAIAWQKKTFDAIIDPEKERPRVIVRGTLLREDWGLTTHGQTVPLIPKGRTYDFAIQFELTGRINYQSIYMIGPLGQIEENKFALLFEGWEAFRAKRRAALDPRAIRLSGSLGYTSQTYTETGLAGTFRQSALTGKISYSYPLSRSNDSSGTRWGLGLSAFMTLLPFSANMANTEMRFVGANFRFGYFLSPFPNGWSVTLWGGAYYTTMLVTAPKERQTFGLQNLTGPQLFPTVSKRFKAGNSVSSYVKIAPIADGFTLFSFPANEIAVGISYGHPLVHYGCALSLSLDIARLSGTIETSTINSSSQSLSLGVSW